jgi:hypothetical protein
MQEGLQLKPDDFGTEDGVPVIYIRASADQFLKSEHAARTLPVHPELIRLGLLRLVERKRREGSRWVFNVERGLDGTFSSAFSKVYHNWRVAEGIYERGKDFHSIRKDFWGRHHAPSPSPLRRDRRIRSWAVIPLMSAVSVRG